MGKGEIISGGENGLYSAKSIYRKDLLEKQITRLDAKISFYTDAVAAATDTHEKNLLTAQLTAVEKRKQYLENGMPDDIDIEVYCADLTEDLTGDIGLIEVPGEKTNFNIQPGFFGNAEFDPDRDGQLTPIITMSPHQAYYNMSVLPGWQKWKPTFRYGTITSIVEDVADVDIEDIRSTQQSLNVNQTDSISDVPIEYMDCNGLAFGVGSNVLVMFTDQDWAQPKIIGFKEEPKPCDGELVYVSANSDGVIYCIIWNAGANAMSHDIPLNAGGFATFPVNPADISVWKSSQVDKSSRLLHSTGNGPSSLYRESGFFPEFNEKSDTFEGHDEDGNTPLDLYANSQSFTVLFPPTHYTIEAVGHSTMDNCQLSEWTEGQEVEILNSDEEFTASRMDLTYDYNNFITYNPSDFPLSGTGTTSYEYDITSPLGTLFTVDRAITKTWDGVFWPPDGDAPFYCTWNSMEDSDHEIIGAYSEKTILQIYLYREVSKTYTWDLVLTREEMEPYNLLDIVNVPLGLPGNYDPRPDIPTDPDITYDTTDIDTFCSLNSVEDATITDPRTLSRNTNFETAINELANTADQSVSPDLKYINFAIEIY